MVVKPKYRLLLLFCIIAITARAQQNQLPGFNLGDAAPPFRVGGWIKGTPVKRFEKGKFYVVEFWATYCKPCIAAMPHLSALAREYKDRVTFLAIDVYEARTTPADRVKTFVEGMGDRMDFNVAQEDTSFTVNDWLRATGEQDNGIPRTFVVDAQGRLAWIGHPKDLDKVLGKVVNNTWDIKEAVAKRDADKYLADMDHDAGYKLSKFDGGYDKPGDLGKPDSALLAINEIVKKEPKAKYAPVIALFTFSALLKTNPDEAYAYGKAAIVTPTYEEPAYDAIIANIRQYSGKLNIPAKIYLLGAETYQAKMDHFPYPELYITAERYQTMAKWYSLAGDTLKATEAREKANKLEADEAIKKQLAAIVIK